jgi:class 3 adenylate cyclase/tetratricopeptide (TPR) repeat protein
MAADTPAAAPPTPVVAAAPASAERRLVTVLFADLVGFTTLAEDRDPEAVRELLTRYFDTATSTIGLHGGTVEKFIGDAVMAVWGTPVAHEDDAERAVRAALELVSAVAALNPDLPDLRARAGVLTGEAAVTLGATNQGMVAGDLVNTAARLQGVAEPGTVLVGETTKHAAENAIVFEPIGDHSLKGKTSPVPAWQAVRVVAARGGQGRSEALEPPFVGREEELRQLKDVLHAIGRERRPRLVSITGPGGIGKSRLVWELEKYIDGVAEDIWWHRGRSPSYGEGITFWALGEMVRRRARLAEDADEATTRAAIAAMLEEHIADAEERERIGPALLSLLGVGEPPPGGRDALFPAWRTFFERVAEKGTTVLVFEDLQWADTGLLDFIDHLLDWSRGLPLMVVTLARPELFDRRSDWGAGRRQVTALALEPLRDADIRQMLEGLVPGLPADALAAIVGRAEGIPLYAVEMVRGLLAEGRIQRQGDAYVPAGDLTELRVPESLRSLIASRLDALDPTDRTLLQDASVLGQVFGADALAATTGIELAELEPRLVALVRREMLDIDRDPASPERGQYRFVQSLIREVAYGTLARRDRRGRHLAVARHYESVGDDELAGALASHYLAAHEASEPGPEADAVATQARLALTAAIDRAASLGAHDQAVRFAELALGVTAGAADRAPLLDRAARSAAAVATPDAERYARAAVDAYRELDDRVGAAWATARLGQVLMDASELNRAAEVLEAALSEASSLDEAPLASTLAVLSRAQMRLAQPEQAIATADRALEIAERLNLESVVVEGLLNKGSAYSQVGRRREAIALQSASLELVQRLGDRTTEMRVRNNLAAALSDDDPARATDLVMEAIEVARDIGDRAMYFWLVGTAAMGSLSEGRDWDGRRAALAEALEMAVLPFDRLRLQAGINMLDMARGERLDDIEAFLSQPPPIDNLDATVGRLITRGEMALIRGDAETAFRLASEGITIRTQDPFFALESLVRSAIATRDPHHIRAAADAAAALPSSGSFQQQIVHHTRAAVAAVDGRIPDAIAGFLQSHDTCTRLGQRFAAAMVAVDAATLLPDAPEIRTLAEASRPVLEELRARPMLERLDAALAVDASPADSTPAPATTDATAHRP